MIGRLITSELAGLRRSMIVWLGMLLVVGGSVVARVLAWISAAVGRTELSDLPFARPDMSATDLAVPLALLAYLVMTAYLFGRDFEDGAIDLLATAPVSREAIVVARLIIIALSVLVLGTAGWAVDLATHAVLATSPLDPGPAVPLLAALASTLAAIATLPLVAWAGIRFQGVLPAIALGIVIQAGAIALGGFELARVLPWSLPMMLATGEAAPLAAVGLAVLLFAGGLAAAILQMRALDLFE